jgi:DNA topoisomerase-2
MIVRMNTPLYVARKKGAKDKYFYTREDYEAASASLKGYEINYMKGLGSLEKEDYKEAIYNPSETVIEYSGIESLNMAFGDDADSRKSWMVN